MPVFCVLCQVQHSFCSDEVRARKLREENDAELSEALHAADLYLGLTSEDSHLEDGPVRTYTNMISKCKNLRSKTFLLVRSPQNTAEKHSRLRRITQCHHCP